MLLTLTLLEQTERALCLKVLATASKQCLQLGGWGSTARGPTVCGWSRRPCLPRPSPGHTFTAHTCLSCSAYARKGPTAGEFSPQPPTRLLVTLWGHWLSETEGAGIHSPYCLFLTRVQGFHQGTSSVCIWCVLGTRLVLSSWLYFAAKEPVSSAAYMVLPRLCLLMRTWDDLERDLGCVSFHSPALVSPLRPLVGSEPSSLH